MNECFSFRALNVARVENALLTDFWTVSRLSSGVAPTLNNGNFQMHPVKQEVSDSNHVCNKTSLVHSQERATTSSISSHGRDYHTGSLSPDNIEKEATLISKGMLPSSKIVVRVLKFNQS